MNGNICDNNKINVRISNQNIPEVEEFCYLGSKLDIKSRITQGKRDVMQKRSLVVSNIDL